MDANHASTYGILSRQSGPVIRSHGSLRERREAGSRLAGVVAQAELNGGRWPAGGLGQLVSVSQPRRRADMRRGLGEAVGAGLITIAGPFAGFASRGYCTALHCTAFKYRYRYEQGFSQGPYLLGPLVLSCLVFLCSPVQSGRERDMALPVPGS